MRLATILITLLLIGGFTTGVVGFYGALLATYGIADNSPISSYTLNTTNQTYEMISNQSTMMSSAQRNVSAGTSTSSEAPWNLIIGSYQAVMLILQTPTYLISISSDLMGAGNAYGLGMPMWVSTMIGGIIFIIVLFALISFITGRETE